jgi:hypothetical protein
MPTPQGPSACRLEDRKHAAALLAVRKDVPGLTAERLAPELQVRGDTRGCKKGLVGWRR